MKRIEYPFMPKSTSRLIPGQFWGVPLINGTYGCGRVIQLPDKGNLGARTTFLAGLLDWNSRLPPTGATIANAPCIEQGVAHLKLIWENGRMIIGFRPLEDDGIEPWMFRRAEFWRNSDVQKGFTVVRPQTPADDNLPVLSHWGYKMITLYAEKRFL